LYSKSIGGRELLLWPQKKFYDLPRRTHDDKINQDIYFVNEHCYNTKNSIKVLGERGLSCRPEAWARGEVPTGKEVKDSAKLASEVKNI